LHLARTITRRAERTVTTLLEIEPDTTSIVTMQYLNRLSDLLFVLARAANNNGQSDVLWVPGKNR
jgi:cob(I)alamin adenosyltransferase